jgi:hypothetical protein
MVYSWLGPVGRALARVLNRQSGGPADRSEKCRFVDLTIKGLPAATDGDARDDGRRRHGRRGHRFG